MSDYWHAVGRAALGLTGNAQPRRRSIFEDETGEAGFIARDAEEIEEPAPLTATHAPLSPPRVDATAVPSQHTAAVPSRPTTSAAQSQLTPSAAPPLPPAPAVTSHVDSRVEVNTIERKMVRETERRVLSAPPEVPAPGEVQSTEPVREVGSAMIPAALPIRLREPLGSGPVPEPLQPEPPSVTEAAAQQLVTDEPLPMAVEARQVQSAMVIAEPRVASLSASEQPEVPPLVIEIGRIDIRIGSEPVAPPAVPTRRNRGPVLSLDDYLAQRSRTDR